MVEILNDLQPTAYRDFSYQLPVLRQGGSGRPPYVIPPEQLSYLLGLGFSVTRIAALLGVDRSTIHGRLRYVYKGSL